MKNFVAVVGWLVVAVAKLAAQQSDSVITINTVEAKGNRFGNFASGTRLFTIDSLTLQSYKSASVADLLAMHSLASVNSYGPEGVASVSLRGGSTRHTAVIWNGINLRSHTSGGFNFSALPAGFVDILTIQSGGSSTLYGSGTSNGAIILSNNLQLGFQKVIGDLNFEAGSFGSYSTSGSAGYISPRFATRVKAGYQFSENDFEFENTQKFGDPIEKLEHAAFNRFSFAQQNVFKTGNYSKIESDFLYTKLYKQVPSLMSDLDPGSAEQKDKSTRLSLNFSTTHSNWFLKLRSGLIADEVCYYDSLSIPEPSLNKSLCMLNEVEYNIKINNLQTLNLGIDQTSEFAKSNNYIADTSRFRVSFFGRYTLTLLKSKLTLSAEGRKEYVSTGKAPFVYSFFGAYTFVPFLTFKTIFSKHYSLPVFDDLFWGEDAFARGNPNLNPENGFAAEIGLSSIKKINHLLLKNEATVYYNEISGLIIWLIGSDGKSTPTNMQNSINRGIEFSGCANRKVKNSNLSVNYMYAYSNAQIYDNPSDQHGSQRYYVPKHKANVTGGYTLKNMSLIYTQSFYSKRYTDKIYYLDAYTLADINLSYLFLFKKYKLAIYFKIKNIYNTNYQVMSGYAQPMRNFCIGINLTL